MITVILTGYKRPHTLKSQLEAIRAQTVQPKEIMFCHNEGGVKFDENLLKDITVIKANVNYGVWARFAYALNASTEYICIFDDDTIPGCKWFENCLDTIKKYNGLLGTSGIRFGSTKSYYPHVKYGWNGSGGPNEVTQQVDIVGHSWFFKREWLSYFWSEMPTIENHRVSGEDVHFSYMLQKKGLGVYVPPHPKDNSDLWGSQYDEGVKLGTDYNAISMNQYGVSEIESTFVKYVRNGFSLYNFRKEVLDKKIMFNHNFKDDFEVIWDLIRNKKNFAFSRSADGEKALMCGKGIPKNVQAFVEDKWHADDKMYKIGMDLINSMQHKEDNYIYGIASNDQSTELFNFYKKLLKQSDNLLTYSDIFINSNYRYFLTRLEELDENVVVIASKNGINNKIANIKPLDYYPLEHDCVNYYENNRETVLEDLKLLATRYTNKLFLIGAGPMSPIIVHTLYQENRNNRYVDIGSALDEFIHLRKTRPYMKEGTYYYNSSPTW